MGNKKGKTAKSHVGLIFLFFLVKRAGRHFGFFKRAGRHEKGAGRRALQKKPRQNTEYMDNNHVNKYTAYCKMCCQGSIEEHWEIKERLP